MNKQKLIAGVLVLTVVTGNVAFSGINAYASKNDILNATDISASSDNSAVTSSTGKEEVVYIMTSADGTIKNVNVVNIFGKGSATDYGNYSSVKMLNTTDAISKNGDTITFSTDKDKVYYQGTLENVELPWNIAITYKLDGKVIAPEDIAGKTGSLSINIKITKNEKCETSFYDNYALQAALTLDTDKCINIKADGATLANVGADKQISYTVLPGKGLDAVIEADVTDFEMDAVSINGVKLNLNIDIDNEELMEKVTEIMNAAKNINDGAGAVTDGVKTLNEGGSSLYDGAKSLDLGVNNMDTGISSLSLGVTDMQEALDTLNSQSSTLTTGSSDMYEALKTVQAELSKVSLTTEQLKQLTDSSAAIKQGINDIYDGAEQLQASLSYDSYKNVMSAGGLDIDKLQSENAAAVEKLSSQVSGLSDNINTIKSIEGYESNENLIAQVAQLEAQVDDLKNIITLLNGNNAAIYGTSQYINEEYKAAGTLVAALSELKGKYEAFDMAILTFANTLSDLAVNVSRLNEAINMLVFNYGNLDAGINAYTDGVAQIVAAYSQLVTGTNTLASGSRELVSGSSQLKQGVQSMYEGTESLYDGSKELSSGTQEFYDKTDGLDSKIQNEIDDMISSISGSDKETVSFVSDKNKDVNSVQFVIKTDSIQKPEVVQEQDEQVKKLTFWQKLLKLFGLYK